MSEQEWLDHARWESQTWFVMMLLEAVLGIGLTCIAAWAWGKMPHFVAWIAGGIGILAIVFARNAAFEFGRWSGHVRAAESSMASEASASPQAVSSPSVLPEENL